MSERCPLPSGVIPEIDIPADCRECMLRRFKLRNVRTEAYPINDEDMSEVEQESAEHFSDSNLKRLEGSVRLAEYVSGLLSDSPIQGEYVSDLLVIETFDCSLDIT